MPLDIVLLQAVMSNETSLRILFVPHKVVYFVRPPCASLASVTLHIIYGRHGTRRGEHWYELMYLHNTQGVEWLAAHTILNILSLFVRFNPCHMTCCADCNGTLVAFDWRSKWWPYLAFGSPSIHREGGMVNKWVRFLEIQFELNDQEAFNDAEVKKYAFTLFICGTCTTGSAKSGGSILMPIYRHLARPIATKVPPDVVYGALSKSYKS